MCRELGESLAHVGSMVTILDSHIDSWISASWAHGVNVLPHPLVTIQNYAIYFCQLVVGRSERNDFYLQSSNATARFYTAPSPLLWESVTSQIEAVLSACILE